MVRADRLPLSGPEVPARQRAALARAEALHRRGRVHERVEAVSEERLEPLPVPDAVHLPHVRRSDPGAVVLHPPRHVVRDLHVDRDVVELPDGKIVRHAPVLGPVARDDEAAVVPEVDGLPVPRIDPHGVEVRVDVVLHRAEGAPAVIRDPDDRTEVVDPQVIRRIDVDLGVVERAVEHAVVVVDQLEVASAVGGEVQPAVLHRLDQRVDPVRVRARDREAHAPHLRIRESVLLRQLRPALAPVVRDVEPRPVAVPGLEEPGPAPERPHGREHLVRVLRVLDELGDAGVLVHVEDLPPGLATVGGLVDAALRAGRPDRAHGAHPEGVRIVRVQDDPVDLAGLLEAHELPGRAAVHGAVDARARIGRVAGVPLAGADPDDVAVAVVHGDRTDVGDPLVVEERRPGVAGVRGLPDTAGSRADVDRARVGLEGVDRRDASAHSGRPDRAGLHGGELVHRERLSVERGGRTSRGEQDEQGQREQAVERGTTAGGERLRSDHGTLRCGVNGGPAGGRTVARATYARGPARGQMRGRRPHRNGGFDPAPRMAAPLTSCRRPNPGVPASPPARS